MKTILILLALAMIPVPATAQTADPMRGFIWGLPREAVQGYEPAEFLGAEGDTLVYSGVIVPDLQKEPLGTYIEYRFSDNKLDQVRYNITIKEGDPGRTLDDVMTLQLWLDAIFNQTSKPDFRFSNTTLRDDPARWGWAIYRGEGTLDINWATPDTKAALALRGNADFEPRLTLIMTPVKSTALP